VSIHANSFGDPDVKGVETWIIDRRRAASPAVYTKSRALARLLQKAVVNCTKMRDRGVRQGGYVVLRSSKVPAALVEVGFLTNPATEKMLADAKWRERIAQALAKAVAQWLGQAKR
jgi:N-acetylmuramoyl-L-alanine amidase